MPHDLPSSRHLADFHAFFDHATFKKNGDVVLTFVLPREMVPAIVDLAGPDGHDGLMLNVTVWETALADADEELAKAIGMD